MLAVVIVFRNSGHCHFCWTCSDNWWQYSFLLIMCLVDYLIKPGYTDCLYHSLDCFSYCFYLMPLWKRVIYKNFTLNSLLIGWLYLLQIWRIYNKDQLNIWYPFFFFDRCVHICFLVIFDLTAQLVGS